MDVPAAIAARRSVRGFTDRPVPVEEIAELARAAARAPSGGNLQPWHVDIVAGAAMDRLKAIMRGRLAEAPPGEPAYAIYPPALAAPYRDRRFAVGEALYERLGIARADKAERIRWFARNFQFFGAPAALFVTVDRAMGPPQWSDLGMYLQSFMLLALDRGLATCPQECWALYPDTIGQFLPIPPGRMLFCAVAIGHEDAAEAANALRTDRAPAGEWLRIVD